MNTSFLSIIKRIIAEQGEAILACPQRLKGLIKDYAQDEPKPERLAFGRCIEGGAYNALKNAHDAGERVHIKETIARRLYDEEGLSVDISMNAMELLETALFNTPSKTKAAHIPNVQTPPQYAHNTEEHHAYIPTQNTPTQNTALSFFTSAKVVFISRILAAVLLFIGITKQPYSYYKMLRLVITIIAVLNALSAYSSGKFINKFVMALFVGIAVLFNPIIPVYLNKDIWQGIDMIAGAFFCLSLLFPVNNNNIINSFFNRRKS